MKHLSVESGKLKNIFKNKCVFLFLDYDGTVAPIAPTPKKAIISVETKKLLKTLSESSRCKLAIISGRALKDLKKMVSLKNIFYAGNHGVEIEGPKLRFEHPMPYGYKLMLRRISNDLHLKLSKIRGIVIEDKDYSMSLHYRLVNPKLFPDVCSCFNQVVKDYLHKIKLRQPAAN